MKTSLSKLFLFLCLFIVSTVNISAQDDWAAVRKFIEEMNNEMETAIVAGDMESMMKWYTTDVISLPNGEPAMKGLDQIKKKAKKDMESGFKVKSAEFTTTDVFGSGNLAVEVGEWDMTMNIPGMNEPWSDTGKYVTVWQKQMDGSWKIKVETWNTNTNPMMATEQTKSAD